MSSMDIPAMCEVLGADLGLALVAVVEAVHAAVAVARPGPRPAGPGHVQGLAGGGVGAAVLDHGDAVLRHAASNLIATPPIVAIVTISSRTIPVQSS